jgi:hypothetical protein
MNRIIDKIIKGIKSLFRKPVTPTPETVLEQAVIEPTPKKSYPETRKSYVENNRERHNGWQREWHRKYRLEHKDEADKKRREYQVENKDKLNAYYQQNSEHINKIRRERYHRNKAKGE